MLTLLGRRAVKSRGACAVDEYSSSTRPDGALRHPRAAI